MLHGSGAGKPSTHVSKGGIYTGKEEKDKGQDEDRNALVERWRIKEGIRRFETLGRLTDPEIDRGLRISLRKKIAEDHELSERTLRRWEASYFKDGIEGLYPSPHSGMAKYSQLPKNFESTILRDAINLRKEVPKRSVNDIIYILEGEEQIEKGLLKRSTLQSYLAQEGFSKKQMAQYLLPPEKDPGTGKRFCKPHRMMLLEGDIKNGPKIRKHPHSAQIKTYLIALLDDHSRFPPYSAFYSSETEKDTLDCLFQAIIRYGLPDAILYDNGSQYNAAYMKEICGRLGIRVRFCKVRHPWTKGVIERFNGVVSSFVAEVEVDKDRINSLEALNKEWEQYCCERYLNVPHEGICEYYEQRGVNVPKEGITPQQEWDRDTRALNIPELSVLSEAFMHRKTLKVDKTGNISFNKRKYYVDVEMHGQHVDVAVDLSDPKKAPDTLAVYLPGKDHNGKKLMDAKPLVIDENCSQKDLSAHTIKAQRKPKESRLLRVVEREYQKRADLKAGAVSYEAVWKKKDEDV